MKIIGLQENSGIRVIPRLYSRMSNDAKAPTLIVRSGAGSRYFRALVAIDAASDAGALLEQARNLAPDADLVLLYALRFSLDERLRYVDASEEKLRSVRMQRHEDALDSLSGILEAAGLLSGDVATIVEHGDAADVVLKYQQELNIDLTVIGTRPTSALGRFFFRNAACEVIEKASCDVLVVPCAGHT